MIEYLLLNYPLQESLDEATDPWGIKVERVEIKDVKLPQQLQRAMAAEAEASREARAKVKREDDGGFNWISSWYTPTTKKKGRREWRSCASVFQIIAAEGEMKASRALKEASLVIAESPSALQLRYLQSLNSIAAEKNSTIIFPLPIDLLQGFMQRKWRISYSLKQKCRVKVDPAWGQDSTDALLVYRKTQTVILKITPLQGQIGLNWPHTGSIFKQVLFNL